MLLSDKNILFLGGATSIDRSRRYTKNQRNGIFENQRLGVESWWNDEVFVLDRIEGDHLIYTHKDVARPFVIPRSKAVPVFIMMDNLRSADISRHEYFQLLK